MAVTVGQLAVELDARTQEFRSAMRGAERRLDNFERSANQSTRAAGLSFRSLRGPIAGVAGALVALGAIRFGQQIASGAIESAAAFESYEIRLRALLGSQQAANESLGTFVDLSTRTPFAVAQIVEGATTLASVSRGSREELEELTRTTANLAAVTGLNFNEAAGNLQRALAAGIGAADLFRDRGVRKLIEEVNGIPDLTKVPLEEQRELFKATFGPDALTPFATAAEELSQTMGGALSNIGDAAANAQRELGNALSPAVFATARAVVIPFFQELEELVVANQDEITEFAVDSIVGLLNGFASMLNVGADVLDLLDELGVNAGNVGRIFNVISESFAIFFDALKVGLQTVVTALAELGFRFAQVGNLVGLVSDEQVASLDLARQLFFGDLAQASQEFAEGLPERFAEMNEQLAGLTTDSDEFAEDLRLAAVNAGLAADEVARLVDNFQAARRERLAAQDEGAGGALGGGVVDPEVEAALAGFEDDPAFVEAQERRLQEQLAKAREEAEKAAQAIGEDLAEGLGDALGSAFDSILNEEGLSFAEGLAQLSGDLLEDSISGALEGLQDQLAQVLSEVDVGSLFGGEGGLASGIGDALGVGLGIAGSFLARELGGTEANVRGGLVDSVVTSTQAVRGIVAGDVNVPIAEVAGALRDMNVQTVAEQRTTNSLLRQILDATRAIDFGGDTGEAALAAVVADELSGSPALG